MKLTKEQLTVYAAGVFDAAGTVSNNRPILSSLQDTKKHLTIQRLHGTFGGTLKSTPGTGKGAGKTFVHWSLPEPADRIKFFKAILPYSTSQEPIQKHITAIS